MDKYQEGSTIESQILYSIDCVIRSFRKSPYSFLYERDIQCALFSEMRSNIHGTVTVKGKANREEYPLELVYSEYSNRELKPSEKIDLICLDAEKATN